MSGVHHPTFRMTPPQQSIRVGARPARIQQHPRRPPAYKSVSLLHSPRQQGRGSDSSSENKAKDGESPSSLAPLPGKGSSGESSNAERWFEQSNNEVRDQSQSFADNDPPFFMRNSSSSDDPADGRRSAARYLPTEPTLSLPMRTGLMHLGTDGSSTEDFRSVIDDLTIENKKLKRRLKKYEKLHDSHLKDEKLFEIRVHGLPPEKKRELEETLRSFTAGLSNPGSVGFPSNGYEGLRTLLQSSKTASSATSLQQPDSAYASMSASGAQGSSTSDSKVKASAQAAKSRHQNIHTYLHHIPEGLLPQQNLATISERDKKKLVVRRLEQIFAGTGAALGGHQQAEQQQSVSNDAARADRLVREAQGHRSSRQEGFREADFMKEGPDDDQATKSPLGVNKTAEAAPEQTVDAKLEQRPTRPLDLDPHRAQIPADNMRYIRKLGFEMPDGEQGSPQDDEGWVYLNVLINMAQLHTMSVTADFVRKALEEFSKHLQLSEDLRKVRWKGDYSVTRSSSNGGSSSISRNTDDNNSSQSPRKRVRLSKDALRKLKDSQKPLRSSTSLTAPEPSRFAYTPLFFHRDSTGDEESSSELEEDDDDAFSPFPAVIGGNSSGMTSSGIRTASGTKHKKKHDDGPIIFYTNARFCTDLSGDRKPSGSYGAPAYNAANTTAIGMPQPALSTSSFEKRGPLDTAADLPEPMDLSDNPIPQSMELNFPAMSPPKSNSSGDARPIDLEVSGIGGVYPADNFSISVEAHYSTAPSGPAHPAVKSLPPQLAALLRSHKSNNAKAASHSFQKSKITSKTELAPSALPPALSYMLTESGSISDDGSEIEDAMSIAPDSAEDMPREPAPQQLDLPYSQFNDSDAEMNDDYGEDSDESDAESDGSLDLLAAAREIDPDAVRAREREYDANMAERLAEEIPAGSSAATAGGGSGFASPASAVSRAEWKRAKLDARLSSSQRERERHRQSSASKTSKSSKKQEGIKETDFEAVSRKRKIEQKDEEDVSSDSGEEGSVSS